MPIFANILQPLIDVFEWVLVNVMHDAIGLSWGWSIVGLTIGCAKALLIALFFMQLRRSAGLVKVVSIVGIVWASFLFILTFADLLTR